MDESFTADSSEIAGLLKLATQIDEGAGVGCRLVLHHTAPFGDFDGELMRLLSTPLQAYTDVTYRRYANLASDCATTGMHLNRAAWMYHDQEKRNYDALNAHSEMSIVDMSPYNSQNPIPGRAVPYVDTLDDAKKKTELGLSIAGAADAQGVLNTPKTGYNPGTGRDPWGDAV